MTLKITQKQEWDINQAVRQEGIVALPKEIILEIFKCLPIQDLASVAQCCRTWRNLANEEALWKSCSERDYPYRERINPKKGSNWKQFYRELFSLDSGMTRGIFRASSWGGADGKVMTSATALLYKHPGVFLACRDGTVYAGNRATHLQTNIYAISHLAFSRTQERLIFGNLSNNIYVWNLRDKKREWGMQLGAASPILSLAVIKALVKEHECLVFTTRNGRVNAWDLTTKECVLRLASDNAISASVFTKAGKLILGKPDGTIKVWNLKICKRERELRDDRVNSIDRLAVTKLEDLLVSCSSNNIHVWNLKAGTLLRTLEGHTRRIDCLLITKEGKLFSDSLDGTIKRWDFRKGVCEMTVLIRPEASHLFFLADSHKDPHIENAEFRTVTSHGQVLTLDFNAPLEKIWDELAHLLKQDTAPTWYPIAMERFSRMPEGQRNQVYAAFEEIRGLDGVEQAKTLFHQSGNEADKARAILNFINDEFYEEDSDTEMDASDDMDV